MMESVLNKLNTMFDNPNIYVLNVCHSPANVSLYDKEVRYNKLLNKYAKKLGITIIDNSKAIYEKNLTVNVFDDDKVHLNPIGYQIMIDEIKKYL
jgi:lysophospholipase L1-like esterase